MGGLCIHKLRKAFPDRCGRINRIYEYPLLPIFGNDVVDYATQFSECRTRAIDECTPIVVEVMIHTLGDYWTEDKPDAPSRIINYHHGLAPKSSNTQCYC